ncbi:hypothetical protein Tco_1519611, partial [Tanacetum coccineum]
VEKKGKEKVVDEQAAHDLLTLHTPKQKSLADQFIFQRRTPIPTESSRHVESPSLDAELALNDSETEFDKEVPMINAGDQDEGQAGPNPGEQDKVQAGLNPGKLDEGQAGSNPGDAAESQPQSSHVVHAGPNLEHMDLEITDASKLHNPKQMDEEFTTTAYLNVQENLKLPTKDQVVLEEPTSSTRTLSSQQNNWQGTQLHQSVPCGEDTSSVPLMTSPVIDLTVSHPVSTTIHAPFLTSTATVTTTTTTTSLPPPPPQTQQSTTYPILVRRIVSKAVDDIVTNAIDWAMQALLRARLSDLPAVDMKEILQQRMFEDKSYKAHEDHKNLFDALQKSLECDYSNQLLADLDKARKKKRKRRSAQQQGNKAPSSSKIAAFTHQSMASATSDTRYESTSFMAIQETSVGSHSR